MALAPPRGTRDFGPEEAARRRAAFDAIRAVMEAYGFDEVQTPTFEELALFAAKSGDGIKDELYAFKDKGGRDLCLRPELTAPVMRYYFSERFTDPKPIKWWYFGNCFRYDRPQAGRYREFWQFGCEQIGAGTPLAYAELIALADASLRAVGLSGFELRVGHVGILSGLVDACRLPPEARGALMRAIDKKDQSGIEQAITTAPQGPRRALERALAARDLKEVPPGEHGAQLATVLGHLRSMGVGAHLDLGIARGLDYYTGIVFEVHHPDLGGQSQLLGGGGYDLSALFGGQATPTMGFGLGFDRALVALAAEGAPRSAAMRRGVYLAALSEAAMPLVLSAARDLRSAGERVHLDLLSRKPAQVAKHADAVQAARLIIVGDRDLEADEATVKDLATGQTTTAPLGDLAAHLSRR